MESWHPRTTARENLPNWLETTQCLVKEPYIILSGTLREMCLKLCSSSLLLCSYHPAKFISSYQLLFL